MALRYIRQVGEALEIAHGKKLVHCDIRPANIFRRSDMQEAVLADFGLALDFETRLTRTRKRERVDGFSAPELYSVDDPVGSYTDVYSLAATLYDLLAGRSPAGALQRMGKPWESPQVHNPEISAPTARAIQAGMELGLAQRPQTVTAWLAMLPNPLRVGNSPPKQPINWAAVNAIAAVCGVLIAATVGLSNWFKGNSSTPVVSPSSTPTVTAVPK